MGYRNPNVKPKPPKSPSPALELKRLLGRFNLKLAAVEQVEHGTERSMEYTIVNEAGEPISETYALTVDDAGIDLLRDADAIPASAKVIQGLLLDMRKWALARP